MLRSRRNAGQCAASRLGAGLGLFLVALVAVVRAVAVITGVLGLVLRPARLSALVLLLVLGAFALVAVGAVVRTRIPGASLERVVVDDRAATGTRLAWLGEDFEQASAHALTRHLYQTQGGHLRDLVLGAVPAQALDQSTQHQLTVGLEDHVDEVHHDDPADVPQSQLTDDLLGGLQVVLGDRLLQVAAGAGELTGIDVHHGHGLGAVDHERTAGGEVDLAVQGLLDLLLHAEGFEQVRVIAPLLQPVQQVRGHVGHVGLDVVPGLLALDDHGGEVLVEHVTHGLDGQIRLGVEHFRGQGLGGPGLLLDLFPLRAQPVDVVGEFFLRRALRRGAHDHAGTLGQAVLEDFFEALTFHVGQLARNTGHRTTRHVHQVAARQGHLTGQAGTLVAHGVLGDLHQDGVPGLERVLDLAGFVAQLRGVPIDFARVEHRVAASPDIHERGFHGRQHVLHFPHVHVADQRILLGVGDEVLRKHTVFEHTDLDPVLLLTHEHLAFDRFAAGQELGLGDHVAATARLAGFTTALPLGFQTCGSLDPGDLIGSTLAHAGRADSGDGAVGLVHEFHVHVTATTPPPATAGHGIRGVVLFGVVLVRLLGLATLGVPLLGGFALASGGGFRGRTNLVLVGSVEHQTRPHTEGRLGLGGVRGVGFRCVGRVLGLGFDGASGVVGGIRGGRLGGRVRLVGYLGVALRFGWGLLKNGLLGCGVRLRGRLLHSRYLFLCRVFRVVLFGFHVRLYSCSEHRPHPGPRCARSVEPVVRHHAVAGSHCGTCRVR